MQRPSAPILMALAGLTVAAVTLDAAPAGAVQPANAAAKGAPPATDPAKGAASPATDPARSADPAGDPAKGADPAGAAEPAGEPAQPAAAPRGAQPAKPPAKPAEPVPQTEGEDEDVGPEAGQKRAGARDERTGHLYFGVGGTAVGPAGSMGPNTPSTALSAAGFGFSGFVGVGLGRHATLQIFGDRTFYLGPAACNTGCSGRGYSLGLGLTYHLAQGLAFDPWVSYGLGYRNSSFVVDPAATKSLVFHGLDVARIALGGDFYPTSFFGFGPYLEADFGTNLVWHTLGELPPDVKNTPRTYAFFSVGVRIAFDPMRKAAPGSGVGSRGPGQHGGTPQTPGRAIARTLGLPGF